MKAYNKHKSKSNITKYKKKNSGKKTFLKFTYFGEEIRTLTKIFKKSPMTIAYSTNNTIRNNYIIREHACGVHELKW
jgi:hypothetical protein